MPIWSILRRLRAVLKDNKGLETLEYAVFAASFLFFIAAGVSALTHQSVSKTTLLWYWTACGDRMAA